MQGFSRPKPQWAWVVQGGAAAAGLIVAIAVWAPGSEFFSFAALVVAAGVIGWVEFSQRCEDPARVAAVLSGAYAVVRMLIPAPPTAEQRNRRYQEEVLWHLRDQRAREQRAEQERHDGGGRPLNPLDYGDRRY